MENLKNWLHYDEEVGIFTWTKNINSRFKEFGVCGCINNEGYRKINFRNKRYSAHRLAWWYVYGEFPNSRIDHIDGNKDNNAINNLRLVTNSENAENLKVPHKDNKTGFLGVYKRNPENCKKPYQANISSKGVKYNIGYFSTAEEAHEAYLKKKREIHKFNTL